MNIHELNMHLNYAAYLARNGDIKALHEHHEAGWPWDAKTTTAAAHFGNLECLKYAHEHGCPWNRELTGLMFYPEHWVACRFSPNDRKIQVKT